MASAEVYQLQTLNKITRQQLIEYKPSTVAILGVAGGNGLENIDKEITKRVYCIDVNKKYLDACRIRYPNLLEILEFIHCDLSRNDAILPLSDIHICNLIIEYLGEESFGRLIYNSKNNVNIITCVIQKNCGVNFVSPSDHSSEFEPIMAIHNDIDEKKLVKILESIDFSFIKNELYKLPNGKYFLRLDFKRK
ncbi:MAG TPA: methyltransferase type 11 [Clostridiaceae bacterium]|nr:methyltransferase type 11 [Clostridiaceae bacterium]